MTDHAALGKSVSDLYKPMKSLISVDRVYDIPYSVEPNGQNHPHVDLKVHPDQIETLPELHGRPDLKDLVVVLNRGPFMTHGSAFANAKPYDADGDVPVSADSESARHWCTSYVTFSFWDFARNLPETYQSIYDSLTPSANGTEICFIIQPAYFLTLFEMSVNRKYEGTNGAVCLIWVSGWGESAAIAHSRWRNATRSLSEFFSKLETGERSSEPKCLTVSQHMLIMIPRELPAEEDPAEDAGVYGHV